MGGITAHIIVFLWTLNNAGVQAVQIILCIGYAEQLTDETRRTGIWLILLCMISFSFSAGIRAMMLNGTNVLASRTVHAKMTFNLLHCEIGNFLERIPMGRIINRFSEDIDNLDSKVGDGFSSVYLFICFNIINFISMGYGAGNLLICIPSIFFVFVSVFYRNWFMEAKREVVRL